jgi:DNA modification methylase
MSIQVGKVAMIPLESVIVGERAREMMGDLDSLENNMKESGLISPLAVKDNKDKTYTLLAGERRLTILERNKVNPIPVRIYENNLSILEMKVIEKSENFHRKDMECYELDDLTMEIHQMQQELHGVKAPGPSQTGWSTENTGEMIGGVSKAAVSQSISRAEAREAFPELFDKCKTASDASKMLKKLDEALVKQTIVQKLESQKSDSTLNQLSKCFILKDFFKGVKEIPDDIMHLVEIDPPYAINLSKQKKKDGESQYLLDDYNEIDVMEYAEFMSDVFKECYRVMSPHSWLICWFAPEPWFEVIHSLLVDAGFDTTRMCGIWTKGTPGQNMNPSIRLSNSYEMFFYAWKGQPALNKAGRGNEFEFSPVSPNQKTHPTERPIDLMKEIYDTFCFPGSRILIPFLGSGSGLLAAYELGMSPVGFELSKGYKDSFLVKVHQLSSFKK